jgi:Holliday junction resolvase-like predicted endonuclease
MNDNILIPVPIKVIRNDGFSLDHYDFIVYLKLLEYKTRFNTNVIPVDTKKLKFSLMINDNRTLKRSLNNLYNHKLIKNKINKFKPKGFNEIELIDVDGKVFEIESFIFNHLGNLQHIGIRMVCYLLTYEDESEYDYTNMIKLKTISERLMLNVDTVVKYNKLIKKDDEYSYLTDKTIFSGYIVHKERYNIPKRNKYIRKNKEMKLEKDIIKNIEIIEKEMRIIDNQYEIKDGVIDILARDKNNTLCIIELKVVPNDEKLVFQSVYYPTQFNETVRMITIAPDYDYRIKAALQSLSYVEMKKYIYNNDNLEIINI